MTDESIDKHFQSWKEIVLGLENKSLRDQLDHIASRLNTRYKLKNNIFPSRENIFRCFREVDINECDYVLIGQDPYHNLYNNIPSACGLSFVTENGFVNPSLRILSESLGIDPGEFKDFMIGNKVLLLNTSLTVEQGLPNSHQALWSNFSNILINKISRKRPNLKWILLGGNAKALEPEIISGKIYKGIHPAAYTDNAKKVGELRRLFLDCGLITN